MTKARCYRCGATAIASTFEEASAKINHSIGLGRGIPCGSSYGAVIDISLKPRIKNIPEKVTKPKKTPKPKKEKTTNTKPAKTESPKENAPQTTEDSISVKE